MRPVARSTRVAKVAARVSCLCALILCPRPYTAADDLNGRAGIVGNWSIEFTVIEASLLPKNEHFRGTATISQMEGSTFSGSFIAEGSNGLIRGRLIGGNAELELIVQKPCAGTYSGIATLDGDSLDGAIDGSIDCDGRMHARFQSRRD